MRLVLKVVGVVVALIVLGALGILLEAHLQIRSIHPPLPDRAAIASALAVDDGPVRIGYVLTSEQKSPDNRIGHPVFVVEWQDGRVLAIDAGMDRAEAVAFGKPFETVLGAEPAVAYGSIAEQLGARAAAVRAIAFTHLHVDHTGGAYTLCEGAAHALTIFEAPLQAGRGNYMTRGGKEDIERVKCADRVVLEGGPVYALPGFPGVAAIAAGGHTPCSTIYFVKVGAITWVLVGDVAFSHRDIVEDRPKNALYSYLLVPESPARLAELRAWLRGIETDPGYRIVVSHALDELEALPSGLGLTRIAPATG
jgi:glyoxylase-like metal-dependent hydrolase (beta-lactamase superfamily II)